MKIRQFAASILAMTAALGSNSTFANPTLPPTILTDTPSNFSAFFGDAAPPPYTGGLLGLSTTYTFPSLPFGTNWLGQLTVTFTNGNNDFLLGAQTDQVQVVGTLQHVNAPHGEAPGPIFTFNPGVIAFNAGVGTHTVTQTIEVSHFTDHQDIFVASLTVQVGPTLNDISSYNFTLTGQHTPAPGGLALLALASLTGRRRRIH